MKIKKYEVTFVVEVRADALPPDKESAKADVVGFVEEIWDASNVDNSIVDSYNFEAKFIEDGEVDE